MKVKLNKGFSLIELLVVVAIIAILSAIALPTYQQYSAKVKIAAALNTLYGLAQQAILQYQRNPGNISSQSISLGNTSIPINGSGTTISPAVGGLSSVAYVQFPLSGTLSDGTIHFRVDGTMSSGAVPGNSVQTGLHIAFFIDPTGTTRYYCGIYSGPIVTNLTDVSTNYLPSSCQCGAGAVDANHGVQTWVINAVGAC